MYGGYGKNSHKYSRVGSQRVLTEGSHEVQLQSTCVDGHKKNNGCITNDDPQLCKWFTASFSMRYGADRKLELTGNIIAFYNQTGLTHHP